jgi:hypothetical protein
VKEFDCKRNSRIEFYQDKLKCYYPEYNEDTSDESYIDLNQSIKEYNEGVKAGKEGFSSK